MQKIKLELKDKPLEPLIKKKSLVFTPKKIVLFFSFLFLILVVFYFWKEVSFLVRAPFLEVNQPPADIIVNQDKFEIMGKTAPFAILTIEGEEVYVDKDGNFKKEVSLNNGLNIFKIEAKNRFGKSRVIIRRIQFNQ